MPNRQLDVDSDRLKILARVELFRGLNEDELEILASRIRQRTIEPGNTIVRVGESDASMFVLVEGLLVVEADLDESGDSARIASLEPGSCFGEMSVLTGESRSATIVAATSSVIFEISKSDIEVLLAQRPELSTQLSAIVAERKVKNMLARNSLATKEVTKEVQSFANQILSKMRSFFHALN